MVCKGPDNRGCGAAEDAICPRCERHRCESCCLSQVSKYRTRCPRRAVVGAYMRVCLIQGYPGSCDSCGCNGCNDCEDVAFCWTCETSLCRRCCKVEVCTLCPEVGSLHCRSQTEEVAWPCSRFVVFPSRSLRCHSGGEYVSEAIRVTVLCLTQEKCWDDVMRPPRHCRTCFKKTHPADGSKSNDPQSGDPASEATSETFGPAEPLSDPVPGVST
jgi:hypothetical protein